MSQPRPSDFAAGHHSELSESGAPPSLHDPASGPAQLIGNLWQSYGPGLVAGGALLLQQSAAAGSAIAMNVSAQRPAAKKSASSRSKSSMSNEERRRRLEAELAALEDSDLASPTSPSSASYDIIAPPMGERDLSVPMSRMSSSSSDVRPPSGRGNSGGFEELEVPSDMEHERGFIPTEGKNGPTLRPVGNVGA
jgi:receptor expression-enhancing protein 1/2/3/4